MGTSGTEQQPKRAKPVKEMTVEELRREVYRLQHKITAQGNTLKAKQAIIEHLESAEIKRITDAIERTLTGWRYRG